MATSHLHLFQSFVADESEIHKLVVNHFLSDRIVLQWHPAIGEDLPTPNTNEIVVFSSFFQHEFDLSAYDLFRGLLDHYQILQISVSIHLCEAFLGIPPNFPLFKNYFFSKYQPSIANQKVMGGVGLQTLHHARRFSGPSFENFLAGMA
jgi:hypothetical protein